MKAISEAMKLHYSTISKVIKDYGNSYMKTWPHIFASYGLLCFEK